MRIKVYGKAHLEGMAKKSGNPYNFNQVHYLGKARGVEGQAALTLALDSFDYPAPRSRQRNTDSKNLDAQGVRWIFTGEYYPIKPERVMQKRSGILHCAKAQRS